MNIIFFHLAILALFYLFCCFTLKAIVNKIKLPLENYEIFTIAPFLFCYISYLLNLVIKDVSLSIALVSAVVAGLALLNYETSLHIAKSIIGYIKKSYFQFLLAACFAFYILVPFSINKNLAFYAGFGTDALGYVRVAEVMADKTYYDRTIPKLMLQKTNPELGWYDYVKDWDRPLTYFSIAFIKVVTFSSIYTGYFLFIYLILFACMFWILNSIEYLRNNKILLLIVTVFCALFLPLYGLVQNQYIARLYSLFNMFILAVIILNILLKTKKLYKYCIWLLFIFVTQQAYDATITLLFWPGYMLYYAINLSKNRGSMGRKREVVLFVFTTAIGIVLNNPLYIKVIANLQNPIGTAIKLTEINLPNILGDFLYYKDIYYFFLLTSLLVLLESIYLLYKKKFSLIEILLWYLALLFIIRYAMGKMTTNISYYLFAYFSFAVVYLLVKYKVNLLLMPILIILFYNSFYQDRIDFVLNKATTLEIGQLGADESRLKAYVRKSNKPLCINKTTPLRSLLLYSYLRDVKVQKISPYEEVYTHLWRFFYISEQKAKDDYNSYLKEIILYKTRCATINDTRYNEKINKEHILNFGRYQVFDEYVVNNNYKPAK